MGSNLLLQLKQHDHALGQMAGVLFQEGKCHAVSASGPYAADPPRAAREQRKRSGVMSYGKQRVSIVGNIGRDATTVAGDKAVEFSVAVSRPGGADKKEVTTWWSVTVWGHTDPRNDAARYTKGARVAVDGEFNQRDWTDKQGKAGTTLQIRAQAIGGNVIVFDEPKARVVAQPEDDGGFA